MSWQKVIVSCALTAGAVVSGIFGNTELALVLAGGATGYLATKSV